MYSDTAIKVSGLCKNYAIFNSPVDRLKQGLMRGKKKYYREFQALHNVSFTIKRGETVGIVGCNGSGKSTLLQLLCGMLKPTAGTVEVNGRISALLELGTGFNPEFSGKENIYLNASILGLSKKEIEEKYDAIVAFADIGDHLEQPVKTYSSGMYVRLAFAVAVAVDPDILIVDEALSVGDEAFQRKCFSRIEQIREHGGTILFVSHGASTIVEICDKAILLDHGELLFAGAPKPVISEYHKLIYAPAARQSQLREELKQRYAHIVANKAVAHISEKADHHTKLEASFNEGMEPKSRIVYEENGAYISNARITTREGMQVNILNQSERYIYRYDVTFRESAKNVRFGMMIKTKSGIELGGASALLEGVEDVEAGEHYEISFDFKALLLPNTYFLNCGCSAMVNGERVFLHRIADAVMFKVQPGDTGSNMMSTGIVDFLQEPGIVKVS